jgi:SAM-dependent methyltransferase
MEGGTSVDQRSHSEHRDAGVRSSPEGRAAGRIKGSYGIDAPYVPILSLLFSALAFVGAGLASNAASLTWRLVLGLALLFQGVWYLKTTYSGKFQIWAGLIDQIQLRGDEAVLDVGCGRGMVLITLARHLVSGRATGIDLWRSRDQSGNDPDATRANAERNGVADRIDLNTADMTDLPFPDASFDVVTANVAIQNVKDRSLRRTAIEEMVRVTRPGGTIIIVDIQYVAQYKEDLLACGAREVAVRRLGPVGWFGNPFFASRLVSAQKP